MKYNYTKKIFTAFIIRGIGAFSTFIMTIVIAQQLTQKEAGYYFLGWTILTILTTIGLFGTQQTSLRYLSTLCSKQDWKKLQESANTFFLITITSTLILILITWAGSAFIANKIWQKPLMENILKQICWIAFFSCLSTLVAHYFQAIHRTNLSIFILNISIPLGISICYLITNTKAAQDAFKILLIASLLNTLLSITLWNLLTLRNTFKIEKSSQLLKTSFSIWITSVMAILTTWGGYLIAGSWINTEELSLLAVAQRSAMLISFILIATNLVTAPYFAKYYHQNKQKDLKNLAIKTTRLMVGVSIPVTLALLFFSNEMMRLFGAKYPDASHLLIILSIGQLVNTITGSVGYLLNMTGHEKDLRNIIIITGIMSLIISLILTPTYGVTGTAIAIALGISIQNLSASWMVKKRLGFNLLKFWQKI